MPRIRHITRHAYERAEERLGASPQFFCEYVRLTSPEWLRVNAKYLLERGVARASHREASLFVGEWSPLKRVAYVVSDSASVLITLFTFRDDAREQADAAAGMGASKPVELVSFENDDDLLSVVLIRALSEDEGVRRSKSVAHAGYSLIKQRSLTLPTVRLLAQAYASQLISLIQLREGVAIPTEEERQKYIQRLKLGNFRSAGVSRDGLCDLITANDCKG